MQCRVVFMIWPSIGCLFASWGRNRVGGREKYTQYLLLFYPFYILLRVSNHLRLPASFDHPFPTLFTTSTRFHPSPSPRLPVTLTHSQRGWRRQGETDESEFWLWKWHGRSVRSGSEFKSGWKSCTSPLNLWIVERESVESPDLCHGNCSPLY